MKKLNIIEKLILVGSICFCSICSAKVITYPVPISEKAITSYDVFVNGEKIDLYRALSPEYKGGDYFFTYFDFDGEVNVEVRSKVPFSKSVPYTAPAEVKEAAKKIIVGEVFPSSIKAKVERFKVSFKQDKPFKAVVIRNGRERPLIIFGNPIEKNRPKKDDPNVLYFEAGVHYPEKEIRLKDNQILYLEGGAVLKSPIYATGKNIKVCGRGIISLDRFERGLIQSVKFDVCENLIVEDIIIKDPISWTFILQSCNNVVVDNLKICASRMLNDDAIDICNSSNVVIKNTFTRSQDDSVAIKGIYGSGHRMGRKATENTYSRFNNLPVENIEIYDCIFWSDHANTFRIGYECDAPFFKNIKVRNIQIPYYSKYRPINDYWAHATVLLLPTNDMKISDVHFENIQIRANGEDMPILIAKPRLISGYFDTKTAGSIENCSIKNVSVTGQKTAKIPYTDKYSSYNGEIYIEGFGAKNKVKNLVVEDISFFGKKSSSATHKIKLGDFIENVKVLSDK